MRAFTILSALVAGCFLLTFTLDVSQRKLTYPNKETIIYASMWAPSEPMQQAYRELFDEFEKEYPQYHVEARWDGRWVLPAVRPRLLTGSDVPDLLAGEGESWRILAEEGYALQLDDVLKTAAHPDDAGQNLRAAYPEAFLERFKLDGTTPVAPRKTAAAGLYAVPSGVYTTCIFYNKRHYAKLGLKLPKTWSEFLDNCEKLKQAGFAPIAADRDVYAGMWSDFLLRRAVGEDTLKDTIEGKGPAFDVDPRYRAVFQAIRDLHKADYHMHGWEGSKWPAAQRRWTQGEATHLICGSWIVRETLNYNPSSDVFEMGAFPVPALDTVDFGGAKAEPLGDPHGVDAGLTSHIILKGGRCRTGAIELLRFMSRRKSAEVLAKVGKDIPAVTGAKFPVELEEVRESFQSATTIYVKDVGTYAPKWAKFIWGDLYHDFFMASEPGENGYMSVDEFLKKLQAKSKAYQDAGGEEGIQ